MSTAMSRYSNLFKRFLDKEISVCEFQSMFFQLFKSEECCFEESVFQALDDLFGNVDAYTDDPELLRLNPSYYIDETQLRAKVCEISLKLEHLASK